VRNGKADLAIEFGQLRQSIAVTPFDFSLSIQRRHPCRLLANLDARCKQSNLGCNQAARARSNWDATSACHFRGSKKIKQALIVELAEHLLDQAFKPKAPLSRRLLKRGLNRAARGLIPGLKMGLDKVSDFARAKAEYIVSADSSCIMHQRGCAERADIPIKFIHIAQILNGAEA
jgi:hypothetical protein